MQFPPVLSVYAGFELIWLSQVPLMDYNWELIIDTLFD